VCLVDLQFVFIDILKSGMWAELRTVAANNNRVHMPWSLYYCLFAPHMWCCSSCTSRSWWFTHSTPTKRLQ